MKHLKKFRSFVLLQKNALLKTQTAHTLAHTYTHTHTHTIIHTRLHTQYTRTDVHTGALGEKKILSSPVTLTLAIVQ